MESAFLPNVNMHPNRANYALLHKAIHLCRKYVIPCSLRKHKRYVYSTQESAQRGDLRQRRDREAVQNQRGDLSRPYAAAAGVPLSRPALSELTEKGSPLLPFLKPFLHFIKYIKNW